MSDADIHKETNVQAAGEALEIIAREVAVRCGMKPDMGSVIALEAALGVAWTRVSKFQGAANDTPERMQECIRMSQFRIAQAIEIQHINRAGWKP